MKSAILIIPLLTLGATYYVSPTGNDANAGTQIAPWSTVQKAANIMVAGDVVNVTAGTYAERVTTAANGSSDSMIRFVGIGSPTINSWDVQHKYIEINGFNVVGTGSSPFQGAVYIETGAHFSLIQSNIIHDCPGACIWFVPGGTAASQSASNSVIQWNVLHDPGGNCLELFGTGHTVIFNTITNIIGADAIDVFGNNHIIRSNLFSHVDDSDNGNHGDIIQTFGINGHESTNILFEANDVLNCYCQIGNISVDGANIHDWTFRNNVYANVLQAFNIWTTNTHIYNNVFYRCTTNAGHVIGLNGNSSGGHADNSDIRNNVFLFCGDSSQADNGWYQSTTPGPANLTEDYNYVAGNSYAAKTGFTEAHGVNGGAPSFVNEGTDFHLRTGSVLAGAGIIIPSFPTDKDSRSRQAVGSWDIGAYEYQPPSAVLGGAGSGGGGTFGSWRTQ